MPKPVVRFRPVSEEELALRAAQRNLPKEPVTYEFDDHTGFVDTDVYEAPLRLDASEDTVPLYWDDYVE